MTSQQIFTKWQQSLTGPEDSIYYYHSSIERIILALSLYEVTSQPYINRLENPKELIQFNQYINDTVIAWINNDTEQFEDLFILLMELSNTFHLITLKYTKLYPNFTEELIILQRAFYLWNSITDDLSEETTQKLLNDLSSDGQHIHSEKMNQIMKQAFPLLESEDSEITPFRGLTLIEMTV